MPAHEMYSATTLRATFWDDVLPAPPDCTDGFLRTTRGTTYRLEAARELPSGAWRLDVTRPPDEVPDDALVIEWRWNSRRRRSGLPV